MAPEGYTIKNLRELEDSGDPLGISDVAEVRFAREPLGAEDTGMTLHVIHAGQRNPFAHRHETCEETYVVVSGRGRAKVGDDILDISPLDAVRVAGATLRAFEAGDEEDLVMIAFGTQHGADETEFVEGFWEEA